MKALTRTCITAAVIVALATPAHAEMLHARPASDRERIEAALDREEVRAEMQARGVSPEQAKARVAMLTDDEARRLAAEIDTAPAGGFLQFIGYAIVGVAYVVVGVVLVVAKVIDSIAGSGGPAPARGNDGTGAPNFAYPGNPTGGTMVNSRGSSGFAYPGGFYGDCYGMRCGTGQVTHR